MADIDGKAKFEQFMHDLLMDKDSNGAGGASDVADTKLAAHLKQASENARTNYNYPLIIATGNASGHNNTTPSNVYLLQPKKFNKEPSN